MCFQFFSDIITLGEGKSFCSYTYLGLRRASTSGVLLHFYFYDASNNTLVTVDTKIGRFQNGTGNFKIIRSCRNGYIYYTTCVFDILVNLVIV